MRARDRDDIGADRAVEEGVVGTGGHPDPDRDERMAARFAEVPEGAFVWTREQDGAYRLGRVTGPYRRDERLERAVGIGHARDAEWLARRFGEDEVPAAVAATFARGGRNFQRTHDRAAERQTAELWDA